MPGERLVLKPNVVQAAIRELMERSIHQYFPAYLHLRALAGRSGRESELEQQWKELGAYLEVTGAPATKPYLRPFGQGGVNAGQEWLNSNLAGSYAGSSLRVGQPPLEVVEYDKATRTFSLKSDHWKLAREHLLYDTRAPLAALSVFFMRDFAFTVDATARNDDLMLLFLSDFGYSPDFSDLEVNYMYEREPLKYGNHDWFEIFDAND